MNSVDMHQFQCHMCIAAMQAVDPPDLTQTMLDADHHQGRLTCVFPTAEQDKDTPSSAPRLRPYLHADKQRRITCVVLL